MQHLTSCVSLINTGFSQNAVTDVGLICGSGATLTTVSQNGGTVTIQGAVTTATVGQSGGTLIIQDGSATTITALNGTVVLNSTGTVTTLSLFNAAIFNCDSDPRAKDVTNPINVYDRNVTIKDNNKTINSGTLTLALSSLDQVNVFHGGNTSAVYT